MFSVPQVPYQTKQEWIYRTLRDAIRNCEINPGERLIMDNLAAQFHVSRIPIREALLQLQSEGLVEMEPHMGAVVAPITYGSANDYFAISRELQVLGCRAAAERITEKELKELEDLVQKMEQAAKQNDLVLYSQLNHQFHDFLMKASKMPLIPNFMQQFQQHWQRIETYYHLYPMSHERMEVTLGEHREILNALKAHDADKAEQASRKHNLSGLADHLKRMKENKQ